MHRPAPRLLAATLAAGLLLCACTSDTPAPRADDPAPSVSASPSASPSPTAPSATPPALPAAARGTSPAAAKAFVRHWIEAMNYAARSGDTSYVEQLSSAECESCTSMIDRIDSVYERGGRFEGDGWIAQQVRYQPLQPRRSPVLAVRISVRPQVMVPSAGAKRERFAGGSNQLTFRLERDGQAWRTVALERVA